MKKTTMTLKQTVHVLLLLPSFMKDTLRSRALSDGGGGRPDVRDRRGGGSGEGLWSPSENGVHKEFMINLGPNYSYPIIPDTVNLGIFFCQIYSHHFVGISIIE